MKIARRVAFVFLAVMLGIVVVYARSTGAPVDTNPEICDTMIPGHQLPAQIAQSPYSIVPARMKYMPGKKFTVTINAPESKEFKGIFMQMRRKDTNAILGTWSGLDADKFKTVSCAGVEDNVVTHVDSSMKGIVNSFMWTAPQDLDADVYIAATLVKEYGTFWVNQTSSTISVSPCASDPCFNGGTCTNSAGDTTYTCSCPPPFAGPTCQTAIRPCVENSCENGATCNGAPGEAAYTCTCPADYTGTLCETSLASTPTPVPTTPGDGQKLTNSIFIVATAICVFLVNFMNM